MASRQIAAAGKPVACHGCSHYFITHDANFSYGCRALRFKSRQQPMLDVIAASGQQCLFFRRKEQGLK
ncbi:hypothetical protein GALL_311750 [mine drainage metagenome]|uniref:Uracil-DNA glycosylase n=1 Tax=mine drainage metagenome TaxID=410659 RepID=A0A1J5R4P1_9ZZZZ